MRAPLLILGAVAAAAAPTDVAGVEDAPPQGFRVAFFGDTKVESESCPLLEKLAKWDINMIVHAGDFSYNKDQSQLFTTLDKLFGRGFPFVASVGNHDLAVPAALAGAGFDDEFTQGYSQKLRQQEQNGGVECTGTAGVMEKCYHRGMVIVNLAYGLEVDAHRGYTSDQYAKFVEASFREHPNAHWRFCNFHIPRPGYSTDPRNAALPIGDAAILETCRAFGAVVTHGHYHAYARTKLMSSYKGYVSADVGVGPYRLSPGRSLLWVSGLGGFCLHETDEQASQKPFFDKMFNPGAVGLKVNTPASLGAVICEFDTDTAECEYRLLTGQIIDRFTLVSGKLDLEEVERVLDDISKGKLNAQSTPEMLTGRGEEAAKEEQGARDEHEYGEPSATQSTGGDI